MNYFAILLTVLFSFELFSSLWLYISVIQRSTKFYGLMSFTIFSLLINGTRISLLIWVWTL